MAYYRQDIWEVKTVFLLHFWLHSMQRQHLFCEKKQIVRFGLVLANAHAGIPARRQVEIEFVK